MARPSAVVAAVLLLLVLHCPTYQAAAEASFLVPFRAVSYSASLFPQAAAAATCFLGEVAPTNFVGYQGLGLFNLGGSFGFDAILTADSCSRVVPAPTVSFSKLGVFSCAGSYTVTDLGLTKTGEHECRVSFDKCTAVGAGTTTITWKWPCGATASAFNLVVTEAPLAPCTSCSIATSGPNPGYLFCNSCPCKCDKNNSVRSKSGDKIFGPGPLGVCVCNRNLNLNKCNSFTAARFNTHKNQLVCN